MKKSRQEHVEQTLPSKHYLVPTLWSIDSVAALNAQIDQLSP
jgi:hypothetical protein